MGHIKFTMCAAVVLLAVGCTKPTSQINNSSASPGFGTDAVSSAPPTITGKTYLVGTGSGNLTIDGNDFRPEGSKVTLQNGDGIKIKGGNYGNIDVKNIVLGAGNPVIVTNDGQITFDGAWTGMGFLNLNNVVVTGSGTTGVTHGFSFKNSNLRMITLGQQMHNFTLRNLKVENTTDCFIKYDGWGNVPYNSADPTTYTSNLKFFNILANNASGIIGIGGDLTANYSGLVKKIEIAGIQLTNSRNVGSAVYLGNAEDYDIHNNYISDINQDNNNHNGIFMLNGNGKLYNNLVKNHQGNAARIWTYSTKPGVTALVEVYNNIVYNSRKYSGFETQDPPHIEGSSYFRPANITFHHNSVGKMDTADTLNYPGRLIDVYNTHGLLDVSNNLTFSNDDPAVINTVTWGPTSQSNNPYRATDAEAVVDLINFESKVPGVGAVKSTFVVP